MDNFEKANWNPSARTPGNWSARFCGLTLTCKPTADGVLWAVFGAGGARRAGWVLAADLETAQADAELRTRELTR